MKATQMGPSQIKRKKVGKMVHGSDPITTKDPKKIVTKHQPESRFEDLIKGEFFNCVLKKGFLLSHEGIPKKLIFPSITG
jgi:hypothetical protein